MLKGKIALVTGASRGIGEAIAIDLAKKGADVIINYYNDEEEANRVLQKIQDIGKKGLVIKGDVSDYEDVKSMMEVIEKEYGRLDLVVNNAGIVKDRTLRNMSLDEWN